MLGPAPYSRPKPDPEPLRGMVEELRALHDRAALAKASTLRAALAMVIDVARDEIARAEAAGPAWWAKS